MKRILISILAILCYFGLEAQVNGEQVVYSSLGQFVEAGNGLSFSVTMGESLIMTKSLSGGLSVLQGFQTPVGDGTTGINDLADAPFELKVFPNPAKEQLNIELKGDVFHPIQFQLFDASGKAIDAWSFELSNVGLMQRSANDLAPGLYMLRVFQAEGNYGGAITILKH